MCCELCPSFAANEFGSFRRGDEQCFFDFLSRIRAVRKIDCVSDEIYLHVSSRIPDKSLRELLALFHRYRIEMRQLKQFRTDRNSDRYENKQKFWARKIFGDRRQASSKAFME